MPDRESAEVGRLQNTPSPTWCLAGHRPGGTLLIASLTTGLINGVQDSSAILANVTTRANHAARSRCPRSPPTATRRPAPEGERPADQAGCDSENRQRRPPAALRTLLWVVALIAVVALLFIGLIHTEPVGRPSPNWPR